MQRETNLTVECYASFKNYENTSWDMIILDEAHHITSEKRMGVLGTVEAKYFILLSATLSVQTLWDVSQIIGTIKTSKVTLEDAINWGTVSKPRIYLIPLALDGIFPREAIVEEWGKKKE
jgi:superfamily II DNA or RNA helicase